MYDNCLPVQDKWIAMHDNRNTLQDYGHKKTSASIADVKIPINNFYRSALHVSTKFLMPLWYNPLCCRPHNLVTEGGEVMDFISFSLSIIAGVIANLFWWLITRKW